MNLRIAFHNGAWLPSEQVGLALDDWGCLQGATLVERLRTVGGHLLDAPEHLKRLQASAQVLGIQWPASLIEPTLEECVARNRQFHAAPDLGLVVLLTPGRTSHGPAGHHPTVIMHTVDLQWHALADWYSNGQALVTATNRNVPNLCWSSHLKTRSRLHYFLADRQAHQVSSPHGGAVMLSTEGHVTESSVANLLVIDAQGLVAPPLDSVLHGLSLQRTLRLAAQLEIPYRFQPIELADAHRAQGLLLTGSSGCLWPAKSLDEVMFDSPTQHTLYQALRTAWITDVGLDYTAQAREVAAQQPHR